MSTILNTNGAELRIPEPYDRERFVCHIVTAEWNPEITHALRDGVVDTLLKAGILSSRYMNCGTRTAKEL